jgi:hypothetical protein
MRDADSQERDAQRTPGRRTPPRGTRPPSKPRRLTPARSARAQAPETARSKRAAELEALRAGARRNSARLVVAHLEILEADRAGDVHGAVIPLVRPSRGDVVTVGRGEFPGAHHVTLWSPTVSRLHARLRTHGNAWVIANLSATNPTLLNGKPLPRIGEECVLADGDRLQLGSIVFRFRLG